MGVSSLSGNPTLGGSDSGSFGSSVGSSGDVVTAAETTEAPTTSGTSSASSDATTGDPTTTTAPGTTTTGPEQTTGEQTTTPQTTGGGAACGNGAIEDMEQCDGANLNGFDCVALGNAGGTLQCDPVTCTFDTQLCEGGGGTSG